MRDLARVAGTGARLSGGAAVLALLVGRLGTGGFREGVRAVDAGALGAGLLIGVLTTVCCAWRWRLVSAALGVGVPPGAPSGVPAGAHPGVPPGGDRGAGLSLTGATAAYYRSQFLNSVLPGGVLGDLHRGVRHGRAVTDLRGSLRAVLWDRVAGQVVLLGIAAGVLLWLPSPVPAPLPLVLALLVGTTVVGVVVARVVVPVVVPGRGRRPRALAAGAAWPGVLLASGVAVLGHVATFLVAARTAGVTAPTLRLVPLALVVLLAMAVPANLAGWGPREGVAVWAFAAAGLGAQQGLTTAVVYGVMALVAALPGLVVLVAGRVPHLSVLSSRPVRGSRPVGEVARG